MAPAKLKQHLTTKNNHMSSKSTDCFEWLLESQNKDSKAFVSKVTVSEKVLEARHLVAELNAQERKRHTGGENLTMPACTIRVAKMMRQDAIREPENVEWSWNKQNFGHMSRWCLKPRTILLARTSSNLLDK
jgi:hypothetical protein